MLPHINAENVRKDEQMSRQKQKKAQPYSEFDSEVPFLFAVGPELTFHYVVVWKVGFGDIWVPMGYAQDMGYVLGRSWRK